MLELIRHCQFCGREMTNGSQAFGENPYCKVCLPERVNNAASQLPPSTVERIGHYLRRVPAIIGQVIQLDPL